MQFRRRCRCSRGTYARRSGSTASRLWSGGSTFQSREVGDTGGKTRGMNKRDTHLLRSQQQNGLALCHVVSHEMARGADGVNIRSRARLTHIPPVAQPSARVLPLWWPRARCCWQTATSDGFKCFSGLRIPYSTRYLGNLTHKSRHARETVSGAVSQFVCRPLL